MYKVYSIHSDYVQYLEDLQEIKDFIINQLEVIREQITDEERERIKQLDKHIKEVDNIQNLEDANDYEYLIAYYFDYALTF